jgi:hypothetical protein
MSSNRFLIMWTPDANASVESALSSAGLPPIGKAQIPDLADPSDPNAQTPQAKLYWTGWQDDGELLEQVKGALADVPGVITLPGIISGLEDPATAKTNGSVDPQPGEKLSVAAAVEVADRRLETGAVTDVQPEEP